METNYPSSGSKGSSGLPASSGTTGISGSTTGSAYDDTSNTSSGTQGKSPSGSQSGTWSSGAGMSGGSGSGMEKSGNLRNELSSLKSDLDDLMSRAASLSDRELTEARDKMMVKFGSMRNAARGMADQARTQITQVADQARTQLNQGMDVTSDYVKEKPLQSVAIAAGVGLLIGALMRGGRD